MARGPQVGGLSFTANGDMQQNGDPPRSTLAAQLVQQFTDGRKRPKPHDQETFRQLLQEVLRTDGDPLVSAETHENNVDVSGKLIYVILKAGLDSLLPYDPFDKGADTHQRMIDSLAAIEITIRRCPEVLFVKLPNQETDSNEAGQLFQWLLPRLFSFVARSENPEVQEGLAELVKSCMGGEGRLKLNTFKCRLILAYIKGCTRGSFPSDVTQFGY